MSFVRKQYVHCYTLLLFFNMLQKKAIELSWDLLVNVLKLPKDRMYVTYFGGCDQYNLAPDEETKQIWLDLG